MKLDLVGQQYAAFRKSLGERFIINGRYVKAFCRAMGSDADIAEVSSEKVGAFLNGTGPLTTSWPVRHNAVLGFYRYAISRGFVRESPLPLTTPKVIPTFQPYIYSVGELRRLVASAESCRRPRSDLDPSTLRSLILLMYGAALRTSEALSLNIGDVDLPRAVLTIRDSKFFKSRLVPIGSKTVRILTDYLDYRRPRRNGRVDLFFVGRNSKEIPIHMLRGPSFKSVIMRGCAAKLVGGVNLGSTTCGIHPRSIDWSDGIGKARTSRSSYLNCQSTWAM
jgi:integrase/recombinase XerD